MKTRRDAQADGCVTAWVVLPQPQERRRLLRPPEAGEGHGPESPSASVPEAPQSRTPGPRNCEGMDPVVLVALCYSHPDCVMVSADPIRDLPRTGSKGVCRPPIQGRECAKQARIRVSPERPKDKTIAIDSGWSGVAEAGRPEEVRASTPCPT